MSRKGQCGHKLNSTLTRVVYHLLSISNGMEVAWKDAREYLMNKNMQSKKTMTNQNQKREPLKVGIPSTLHTDGYHGHQVYI